MWDTEVEKSKRKSASMANQQLVWKTFTFSFLHVVFCLKYCRNHLNTQTTMVRSNWVSLFQWWPYFWSHHPLSILEVCGPFPGGTATLEPEYFMGSPLNSDYSISICAVLRSFLLTLTSLQEPRRTHKKTVHVWILFPDISHTSPYTIIKPVYYHLRQIRLCWEGEHQC